MKHAIYVTPHQLKEKPTLGSVFNWTVAQFYADICRNQGDTVTLFNIWNANGLHIINQLQSIGIRPTEETIEEQIVRNISSNQTYLDRFGFHFQTLRDDQIQPELQVCLEKGYSNHVYKKEFVATFCPGCTRILSNDQSIMKCKHCGTKTEKRDASGYFIEANKGILLQKANAITWIPAYTQHALAGIVENFPDMYDLLISKERDYTAHALLHGEHISLDPRFVLTLIPAVIRARYTPEETTLVQGDVVKKGTYYFLTTLDNKDLPSRIIKHGVCLGPDRKKIRRRDPYAFDIETALEKYDARIIRGYFASKEPGRDVLFDDAGLRQIGNFKKTLETTITMVSNLAERGVPLQYGLLPLTRRRFYELLGLFEWSKAFAMNAAFVHTLKREYLAHVIAQQKAVDPDVTTFLNETHTLYFGGNAHD